MSNLQSTPAPRTISQPNQITDWQLQMFMINTLAFQLEKWAQLPPSAPILKENRKAIGYLRDKCRKLIELNDVKPLSAVEEDFYSVGDEFHAILGYIQQQKDSHLAFNLLELCIAMATDDKEYLLEFFLSASGLFSPDPDLGILSVVTMYCPEMSVEKRRAFAVLLEKTMGRKMLGNPA